jgi:methylmalonyl-CoA/ethylmalonyl-CoA epimerase
MPVDETFKGATHTEIFDEPPGFHLGVVVKDRDKTIEALSTLFGLGPWFTSDQIFRKDQMLEGEPMRFKNAFAKLEGLGLKRLYLELIQPVQEGTIYDQFVKTRGEGLHHLSLMVSDWDEMVSKMERLGYKKLVGGIAGGERWCYFEVNPGGLIIEIVRDKMPKW